MDAADPMVKLDMRAFVGGNNWINSARRQAKSDIKKRSSARFAASDSSVTGFRNANQDAWIGAQATINVLTRRLDSASTSAIPLRSSSVRGRSVNILSSSRSSP